MAKEITNFLVDKRLINKHIQRGKITPKEYDQYIAGLKDMSDNAEFYDPTVEVEEDLAPASPPLQADGTLPVIETEPPAAVADTPSFAE